MAVSCGVITGSSGLDVLLEAGEEAAGTPMIWASRRRAGEPALEFDQRLAGRAAGRLLDRMHAGAHDLGRRRSADRLDVRQLAVVDEGRAGGVLVFGTIGFGGAARR
jgi:hypothetical protein